MNNKKGGWILDVQQEIFKTIETIVEQRLISLNLTHDEPGVVLGTSGRNDGKYIVSLKGGKYTVKDGVRLNPSANTPVWVRIPNNDYNQAYICALK